jgi:hypothetical protein
LPALTKEAPNNALARAVVNDFAGLKPTIDNPKAKDNAPTKASANLLSNSKFVPNIPSIIPSPTF